MSKENIVKDMVETMEKDTLRNTDNMVDNFVPDNEGATKDPTPDNEKAINDHVPDSEGEIKASAVLDNKEEINDSAVLDKEKDIKNSAVLDNEREIKDSAVFDNEGETKASAVLDNEGEIKDSAVLDNEGEIKDSAVLDNEGEIKDSAVLDNEGEIKDFAVLDNEGEIKYSAVLDNEGEIKYFAVLDNEEEIKESTVLNNEGEIKDSAVFDNEGEIKASPVLDNEGEIKDPAHDNGGVTKDVAKVAPLVDIEGSTKTSKPEEEAKNKQDDAAVVASLKAEISRQEDNYAQLTRANKELKMNVLRLENDIENVVNTSGFREQTVELSMITFQDLNNELFHNNLWQIRENQIAKKKIKELEDLQAENARKITELTEATTKLADANARLIETGLAKQEEIEMLREKLKEATKKKPSRWQRFKARVRSFFV